MDFRKTQVYTALLADLMHYGDCYWEITDTDDEFSIKRCDARGMRALRTLYGHSFYEDMRKEGFIR